jgi:hypothetical protein
LICICTNSRIEDGAPHQTTCSDSAMSLVRLYIHIFTAAIMLYMCGCSQARPRLKHEPHAQVKVDPAACLRPCIRPAAVTISTVPLGAAVLVGSDAAIVFPLYGSCPAWAPLASDAGTYVSTLQRREATTHTIYTPPTPHPSLPPQFSNSDWCDVLEAIN